MEIERVGGNCIVITTKKAKLVVDPNLSGLHIKTPLTNVNAQLATQVNLALPAEPDQLVLDTPGEYEILDISIKGIPAAVYSDAKTEPFRSTIFRVETAGVSLAITGHINPDLSEDQLEAIGVVDVLVVPIGGNNSTLDSLGAIQIIRAIDPKVVVPTNYAEPDVAYPTPQADLATFVKDLGAQKDETSKLKLKVGGFGEALIVCEIKRSK